MKQEIDAVTRDFISEKCDSRGNQLDQGHDKETRDGLKSLASRVKSGEILVQQTDKSGKLAITTQEEYVASLQPHITSDKVITLEEKNETEKILNGHSIQLTRSLRIGESHRHEPRVKQAVTNKFCHVPVLSGLLKDHKEVLANTGRDRDSCHGARGQEDQVHVSEHGGDVSRHRGGQQED